MVSTRTNRGGAVIALAMQLCIALFLSISCSERQRINPIDPDNPETGGRLQAPELVSFRDTVAVKWQKIESVDISTYNIYRRIGNEPEFSLIYRAQPFDDQFLDTKAAYDVERLYKVSASVPGYETPWSEASRIRPGPSFVWVADADNGQIIKLSHDGEHIVLRSSRFVRPIQIVMNPEFQFGWVLDFQMNDVIQVKKDGEFARLAIHQSAVSAMANDAVDNSLWLLSRRTGVLRRLRPDGSERLFVDDLKNPRAVLVDPRTRAAWVVQTGSGSIIEIDTSGAIVRKITGFMAPQHAVLDAAADVMWVADSTSLHIVPLDAPDRRKIISGFGFLRKLALDPATRACWGIDWAFGRGNSRVIKIGRAGEVQFTKAGFTDLRALAIDAFNSHCFVAEGALRAVTELDASGDVLSRLVLSGGILDVTVETLLH